MVSNGEEGASTSEEEVPREFQFKRHGKYFEMMSGFLPTMLEEFDSIRMSILFFSISGMDLLGTLSRFEGKDKTCDWIYSNLLTDKTVDKTGFRGFNPGTEFSCQGSPCFSPFDSGQLAMTYTALATLLMLGDDLSRVDRDLTARAVGKLQAQNGSFLSTLEGGECDMRYVYCACCVCYILDVWSYVDTDRIVEFVRKSVSFDFAIGQGPYLEGHGGSTFCGLASLVLLGELDRGLGAKLKERIKKWCIFRQVTGFHGRPNKRVDTCYSFWVGGALSLLDSTNLISQPELIEYLYNTESDMTGGFSKWPDTYPDPLHSYMAISGLSVLGYPGVHPVDVPLNISKESVERLKVLQAGWRSLLILNIPMNILSNSLHLPESGQVTILEKECRLVSLPIPSHYPEGDLTEVLAFINSQKTNASIHNNIPDFIIPLVSPLDVTQAQISSLFQDAATNTSLSLSGAAEASPFVETDDDPWKRAWLGFRSGRDLPSLLTALSSSLQKRPSRKHVYTGKSIHGLATLLSLCDYVYHMFSPQLGFGLSVSRQLELFSSLPPYPPDQIASIRCISWHPYLSLLAMAINDHIVQLQNLHSPDPPIGALRHRSQQNITCLQFSRMTGSQLAVGCTGGVLVWIIDLSALLKGTTTYPTKWFPYAPGCPVLSLAWAPNQTMLASCSSAGRHILLIDTPTGHSQPVSRMATRGICLLEWSHDGSKLLSASCTPEFRVWSAESWTCERWDGMSGRIQTAQWSPDGSLLLFAIRNEPYLYSLSFSGCEGLDMSLREGVGGSKSAIKCLDLTPVLCTTTGMTQVEIGGCIQQIAWDTRSERLAILFSPESTPATQELVLVLRTKTGPVLSITPVGFIRGIPSAIPVLLSFRPISDTGATLLVLWNSGYVSLIPFDYSSRVNFEAPTEGRHATSTPLLHASMFTSFSRQHNTSHPILFSPAHANPSPIIS